MSQKIVLIAGYTLSSYLAHIKRYFENEDVQFACVYKRAPHTPTKKTYLDSFDLLFDLAHAPDIEALRAKQDDVLLVTHTQERDVETYIDALALLGRITKEDAGLYRKLVHKAEFKKEMLAAFPGSTPSYHVLKDDTLEEIAGSVTYPQVIKPTGLAGSSFVKVVHTKDEFLDFYTTYKDEIKRHGNDYYQKDIAIIAEEYLLGPQYSVNAYIDARGAVTLCPVIRVVPASELGINDTYSVYQYTQEELSSTDLAALKKTLEAIVTHFKVRSTSAHFDTVLTKDGFKVFEVGLRIGGNRQHFFEKSHGMNHLHNDVANRVGKEVHIPQMKRHVCIMQKGTQTNGVLRKTTYSRTITEPKPALIEEDKIKKIGDTIFPVSEGGATLIRFFVSHKDHEKVMEASKQLFEDITFEIT